MTTPELIDLYTARIVRDILLSAGHDSGRAWRHIIKTELLSFALEIVIRTSPEARHWGFPARAGGSGGRKSKRGRKAGKA